MESGCDPDRVRPDGAALPRDDAHAGPPQNSEVRASKVELDSAFLLSLNQNLSYHALS